MKKQVVVIHGGDPGTSREEYVRELCDKVVEEDDFKQSGDWKAHLNEDLGETFDVFTPRMPLKEIALYSEWKMWFEKLIPFLRDNVILIGHSLGSIFLVTYLSENNFPVKIRAVMLVAAPYHHEPKGPEDAFGGFGFKQDLSKLAKQTQEIYLYHSTDDSIVDFDHMAKFKKDLPSAIARKLEGRDHIWQESFPEIVTDIKKL